MFTVRSHLSVQPLQNAASQWANARQKPQSKAEIITLCTNREKKLRGMYTRSGLLLILAVRDLSPRKIVTAQEAYLA
jgi:hypothetical protein